MRNKFPKPKVVGLFFCNLLFVLIMYIITCFIYFPNSIMLLQGDSQQFKFMLPFQATISSDNISVVKVNNEEVKDNITVNLSDPLTISANESGQASMTLNAFGIPLKKVTVDVMPVIEVVPCGIAIGVKIDTEGVMVLGTGFVNGEDGQAHKPAEGVLYSGDLILKANGEDLNSKDDLITAIEKSDKDVSLVLKREGEVIETQIKPIKSVQDKQNKIGVWVRDSAQGIGTITYYNPDTGMFGALGHGIMDVDTKKLISIKSGEIYPSEITTIKKGKKGTPGELVGDINKSKVLGEVKTNSSHGIYGYINGLSKSSFKQEKMKIGLQNEIHEGPAKILTNVNTKEAMEYDIYIETVNRYSNDDSKGLVIRITDPKLLAETNGIVQGMSGSPIIQDGKLIGAVTHVFVQDPTKGYGIFIENMMKHETQI